MPAEVKPSSKNVRLKKQSMFEQADAAVGHIPWPCHVWMEIDDAALPILNPALAVGSSGSMSGEFVDSLRAWSTGSDVLGVVFVEDQQIYGQHCMRDCFGHPLSSMQP